MSDRSVWTPPAGVTAHDGAAIAEDVDFFAEPPPEIGPVASAYSTLKVGQGADRRWIRAAIVLVLAGLGGYLGWSVPSKEGPVVGLLFGGGFGAAIGLLIAFVGFKGHRCHFIGRDGIAVFKWRAAPIVPGPESMMLFRDALALRVELVDQYHNGIYSGTRYAFLWERQPPMAAFKFHGEHRKKNGPYPTKEPFLFGLAAEQAWNAYQFPRLVAEIERGGAVRFDLKNGDYAVLTPVAIELRLKGQEGGVPFDEIEAVDVERGVVTIRLQGAKKGGFLSKESGFIRFPYPELANGRIFLVVANHLLAARARPS